MASTNELNQDLSNNPLTQKFQTPNGMIPFPEIRVEHFMPAIQSGLADAQNRISQIRDNPQAPSFENTILALETASEKLEIASEVFHNLHGAEADDRMHSLAREIGPKLAEFSNDVLLDAKIFARVKAVYDSRAQATLNLEQLRVLEKSYKGFVRNGALLEEAKKNQLRTIDQELSKLAPQFSENLLKATYGFELEIANAADLKGLPESAVEAAQVRAKQKGKDNCWLFSLEAPSYIPFVTYCENRALREKMHRAYGSRAHGGEFDNQEILKRIANLRYERALLLGFKNHADYVLQERMAETPQKVQDFLERILKVAKPAADREIEEVKELARSMGLKEPLQAWDTAFYSEKLKQKKFNFDEEELRPYFKLENVVNGVFETAKRLYNLEFTELKDPPVYHADVRVFEVRDASSKQYIGLFYTDFFPRPTKRGGAWMTPLREQGLFGGEVRRPHIGIVCNFTKPTETKPSLLSFDEVRTLFHEFGHALHGLLSECTYRSVAGTNVYWDFVELPSQIMENWTSEKEALDLFASHYETGAKIPVELTEKIRQSSTFLAGSACVRQLSLGLLDMAWHGRDPRAVQDVEAFEKEVLDRTRVLPRVEGTCTSSQFSHIFAGGYSAGYYSYKWAEVLDADAFELFKEKGLFNGDVARKFRTQILSRGGTAHPMELYKNFRGREPDPDALLRRDGLIA